MQMRFAVEYVAQGVLGHAQDGGGRGCAAEQVTAVRNRSSWVSRSMGTSFAWRPGTAGRLWIQTGPRVKMAGPRESVQEEAPSPFPHQNEISGKVRSLRR
jgi:hypothetical protein